jgi:predicted nucleic acid-binding protein
LDTAEEHKITLYDASYAYFAKEKQLQLITEDLGLIKKISPTITALTLKDIQLHD